jgi:ribosomal protein S1
MKAEPVKKSTVKKSAAPSSQDPPKRRSSTPPPAVNEPLAFIMFVATYPVGTTLEGEVVSFTSHGAMIDVALPDGGSLHCYIPLSAMGDPPPTKARQMLTKGEVRLFVLSSLDPPRRVAELSLPAPPAKKRRSPTKKAAKALP